jgi:hypothetical protein
MLRRVLPATSTVAFLFAAVSPAGLAFSQRNPLLCNQRVSFAAGRLLCGPSNIFHSAFHND